MGFTEIIMRTSYTVLRVQLALGFSVMLLTGIMTPWFKLVIDYFAFQRASLGILLGKKKKRTPSDNSEEELPSAVA